MLNQLRIAHKLWLAVVPIVVMLIAVMGFSGYRSAKVQAQADAVTKEMEARVSSAIRWAGLTETNAARAKAGERYEAFVTALGRRLAHGPKLRQEISEDITPAHDAD